MSNIVNVYSDNWNIKEVHRNENGKIVIDKKFRNYFYVLQDDINKVLFLLNDFNNTILVDIVLDYDINKVYNTIDGRKVIKIYLDFFYNKFVDYLKKNNIELFESDLSPYVKYIVDNKIKYSLNRRILYLDIETDMCNTPFFPDKSITCIGIYDNFLQRFKIFTFNNIKNFIINDFCDVLVYDNEKEMIEEFINFLKDNSPDIIATWYGNNFDIPYIINRAKKLKINIEEISISDENVKLKCNLWNDKVTLKIGGIDCIDLIPILQRVTAYMESPSNYDLSSVCSFFLGEEYVKKDFSLNNYKEDFKGFLEYNYRDLELLKLLDEKMGLLSYAITLQCEVVPVILNNITFNTYLLEMYLKIKYPHIILLDKKEKFKINDDDIDLNINRIKIRGAFTGKMVKKDGKVSFIDPVPGIYKNVEVLDFSGMYASIYSSFNLSLENLNKGGELIIENIEADIVNANQVTKYNTSVKQEVLKSIIFSSNFDLKERSLIPQIIDEVRERRKKYKKILKNLDKEKNRVEYQKNKAIEDAYKLLGNAFYGVFSYNNFRLFNPYLNGTITKLARDCITFVNVEVEKLGLISLYSDTDSIFIWNNNEKIDVDVLLEKLNLKLKEYVISLNFKLEKWFCMKLDSAYSFKILVMKEAKKRYFGLLQDERFVNKGVEIIRRDYPKKMKPILKELLIDLLYKEKEEIREKLIEIKKYIKTLDAKDLGITLSVSRNLDDYKTNPQHIRGILYVNEYLGGDIKGGDKVKLIFVKDCGKYPSTDVICVTNEMNIPKDFKIDYERFYDFLIVKKLELFDDIKEFNINYLTNKNRLLGEWGIRV